jgi:hypothetical protein
MMAILVRHLAPAYEPVSPEYRLRLLGCGLLELGSMKPARFQGVLRELWAVELSRHALELERLLGMYKGKPDYWAADVEDWLSLARKALADDEALAPPDLSGRPFLSEPLETARHLFRDYGGLLLAWSIIRAVAQELVCDGVSLARPL